MPDIQDFMIDREDFLVEVKITDNETGEVIWDSSHTSVDVMLDNAGKMEEAEVKFLEDLYNDRETMTEDDLMEMEMERKASMEASRG